MTPDSSPEFLADMEALITGELCEEEVRRRIIARARVADREAAVLKVKG